MISLRSRNITPKKFIRYCTVGGTGALLSWTCVYTLTEVLHLWYMFSTVITTFIIVTYNFLLNALWTFREE